MPARQLAVKITFMQFHKNMTDGLVAHTESQTDGQMSFPHKKGYAVPAHITQRHTEGLVVKIYPFLNLPLGGGVWST